MNTVRRYVSFHQIQLIDGFIQVFDDNVYPIVRLDERVNVRLSGNQMNNIKRMSNTERTLSKAISSSNNLASICSALPVPADPTPKPSPPRLFFPKMSSVAHSNPSNISSTLVRVALIDSSSLSPPPAPAPELATIAESVASRRSRSAWFGGSKNEILAFLEWGLSAGLRGSEVTRAENGAERNAEGSPEGSGEIKPDGSGISSSLLKADGGGPFGDMFTVLGVGVKDCCCC